MAAASYRSCGEMIDTEMDICPQCNRESLSDMLEEENEGGDQKHEFNFTVFSIAAAIMLLGGLAVSVFRQSFIIALWSFLGFWALLFICMWILCVIDCCEEKDARGFLLLLLIPIAGALIVAGAWWT